MYSLFSSDIRKLNTLYNRVQFSFIFLYGRPGSGTASLIREFCRDKATLFFSARETVPRQQLQFFWQEAVRQLHPTRQIAPFANWQQAFDLVADYSFSRRLVLVLDELQHCTHSCPDFLDALNHAVAHSFPAGKVFLIVTSSSVDYASQMLEEPIRPPFDAVTARDHMQAVSFYACHSHLSGYAPKDQLLLYGATGGMPELLELVNPNRSAQENLMALFFGSTSPLARAPQDALHRELREVSTYNYLLEIIAEGTARLADIAADASIGTNKCAKYLNILISMGILRKEFPAAGEIQKKVRYVFADHMLRFWYRFVYPNLDGILFGQGEAIWQERVFPFLDDYLCAVFEDVCGEYLERLAASGQAPFAYRHTGSWWCGGTRREPFFRIPLIAMDQSQAVLGICHCGPTPADLQSLLDLQRPLELLEGKTRYCCIFSTSGFTEALREGARAQSNVWLIDLEDITSA
jgi:AAA+ ATPase superfamily predicted ATPase